MVLSLRPKNSKEKNASYGIKPMISAAYHSAINVQAERYVLTLKRDLKALSTKARYIRRKINFFCYKKMSDIITGEKPVHS